MLCQSFFGFESLSSFVDFRYGIVYKLLGGAVSKNSKVKFILTNKLLLMRHFEKVSYQSPH